MNGNWIKQTTTSTGTGNLTLSAVTGFPTFANEFQLNQPFEYALLDSTNAPIEAGIGYLSAPTTLVRARVSASMVSGTYTSVAPTAVSLSAGTTTVICTQASNGILPSLPTVDGQSAGVSRYITTSKRSVQFSPQAPSLLQLTYVPFYLETGATVISLVLSVTGSAVGSLARAGIYSCNEKGYPGALLATSADLNCATTGFKTHTLGTPLTLPPGWYFTAVVMSVNNATLTSYTSTASNVFGGNPFGFSGLSPIEFRYEVLGSLVMPSTANTTTTAVAVGNVHPPIVFLEVN